MMETTLPEMDVPLCVLWRLGTIVSVLEFLVSLFAEIISYSVWRLAMTEIMLMGTVVLRLVSLKKGLTVQLPDNRVLLFVEIQF